VFVDINKYWTWPILRRKNNAEKEGWHNRNQKLCTASCARYGVPSDGTGCHDTLSEYGPDRPILMTDQGAEIALARSAAPESISRDAEVLVLGRHGFETAVKGKNGFVCIVERSWTSAPDPDFWNPKVRTPICFNAAAARSYLPRTIKRTDLILAGRTKAQTDETIAAAIDKKELPAMEPGAICYMMSKQGYGGDSVERWPPHLMFYYSQTDPATWGAGLPDSPSLLLTTPGST
jgi:hypothetical protein